MSRLEPHITIRAVQPVVAALEALGYNADALLAASGIARAALADADARLPHPAIMALWAQAHAAGGDDSLGIHLAEAAPIRAFGVHAYALLASPTLRDAYLRACRYQRLIHETTDLTLTDEPGGGLLQHALPGGHSVSRHPAEFLATLWVRFGRLITASDWAPTLVCFAHAPPADTREHARVFRAPIQFASGRTAMVVPHQALAAANPSADTGLAGILDDYAGSLLAQLPSQPTLSASARAQLLRQLRGGVPTAAALAKEMHISVRTLHRSLQLEGTSFRALLDQIRIEQATAQLANPRISIAEVGFLLGFAEISSFYRAFKRWTGQTPAEFRAAALRPQGTTPLAE